MKEKIELALKGIEENVFYGQATIEPTEKWNYSVFRRLLIEHKSNSFKNVYELAIVRENYIDEDLIEKLIKEILNKTNLKLREDSFKFDYIYNPKSSLVCEVITISFYQSKKVCYSENR